ncbi:MAG: hypothetical protein ACLFVZ_08045, partial [Actinomycetota bacterium]
TIDWETDQDFGYEIAADVPGIDDRDVLQPRRLYERRGRLGEYEEMVGRLKKERAEYLSGFAALDPEVLEGLGGD